MGPSAQVTRHHFCEFCYRLAQAERLRSHPETAEPTVTPPPTTTKETPFVKKPKIGGGKAKQREFPQGLWSKCERCATMVFDQELAENLKVCPHCQFHFRIGARERIDSLVEAGSFEELDPHMGSVDGLNFAASVTYESELAGGQRATGQKEAVITGLGKIGEHRVGLGVLDFNFLRGSMGSVVGTKLTRLIEKSTENALPLIIISASSGARVQEGMFSLMQMAKTCGALARHAQARLPYLSVLTDPTMAGVLASFASLGALILAEPGARIGYAGELAIQATTHAEFPAGFETAEFLLDHGLIDAIVLRAEMKRRLIEYLDFMTAGQKKPAHG